MRDDLLRYYENELTFVRQMGADFAERYPKIASRLLLESDQCADPHVERLIEAFAFLTARVHLKIDDDFPEITESLLGVLYPHFLRPIPSMSVVELNLDPQQAKLSTGLKVPRNSVLYSKPVDGVKCNFRTSYETTIWPLSVSEAVWKTPDRLVPAVKASDAVAALQMRLACLPDVTFGGLGIDSVRFYLNGEEPFVHALYELLCNNCIRILVRDPTPNSRRPPITLPADSLRPVGFSEDEAMLPYPRRSFVGYRLLQEYFSFPHKFFFIDLKGLAQLAAAGFKDQAEFVFLISPFERGDRHQTLEAGVSAKTLRLGCTPIINLFPMTAEPIMVDQTHFDYPIVPDARRRNSLEIFSVEQVLSSNPSTREEIHYQPFYSYRHSASRDKKAAFWTVSRRPSAAKDDLGTDMFLSLVDVSGRPAVPEVETATVRIVCCNRDLPSRLPFGSEAGDFELEGFALIKKIVVLRKPTPTLRPPGGRGALWRLISHLALNYLSLVEEGKEALQEVLRLYNFSESIELARQINGLTSIHSRRHFARVFSDHGIEFARGTRVEIELDEHQFVGAGVYLFASILEHFLGLYVSLNSFSQLVVTTSQRKGRLREWAPRAGQAILI